MGFVVFIMIIGIWNALYGPGGMSLKGAVETQVFRFADGFEGGLGTLGPQAGEPRIQGGATDD